jgi:hypothetical protein
MKNLKAVTSIFSNIINIILLVPILAFVYIIKITLQTIESFWKNN